MGYKAADILGLILQLISVDVICNFSTTASSGDTCTSFATSWVSTLADLQALNPGASRPNLTASQGYCVIGTVTSESGITKATITTTSILLCLGQPAPSSIYVESKISISEKILKDSLRKCQ